MFNASWLSDDLQILKPIYFVRTEFAFYLGNLKL